MSDIYTLAPMGIIIISIIAFLGAKNIHDALITILCVLAILILVLPFRFSWESNKTENIELSGCKYK